jgi:Kef-type K+ transport system membrane component KefB
MGIAHFIKPPFTDAVGIFTTLFIVILILPPIFKRLKIPGIIGLIFAGIIVGPYALNLLSKEIGFNILGSFGLLYLMFLVGLEINLQDFIQHKKKAILFGVFSFFIPFILGSIISLMLFKLETFTSIAIATLLGTHTLVAYPVVSKYGLKSNLAVTLVIGATIIADTLALIFVGIITEIEKGGTSYSLLLSIVGRYTALFLFTIYLLPKLCRWFFRNFEGETNYEFVFTLAMAMICAFIAETLKIEPIIGTFFAGLAMNRQIPHSSKLMSRISFIGDSLFIPLFLISVGILINPMAFLSSWSVWEMVIVLVIAYVIGKYLAALIIQKTMNLNLNQRNLIAGLSSAKAAAAIAIAIIIFKSGLMDETIINITVLLILFTSIYSSFLTEYSSKRVVLDNQTSDNYQVFESDRILVSVSNPLTMKTLLKFAISIKNTKYEDPLFILSVAKSSEEASKNLVKNKSILSDELEYAKQNKLNIKFLSLVDLNISEGISIAGKDLLIDKIIIGWNIQKSAFDYFFGDILNNLLNKTNKMIYAVKVSEEILICNRTVAIIPPNFEYEKSFGKTLFSLKNLSERFSTDFIIVCSEVSKPTLKNELDNFSAEHSYSLFTYMEFGHLKSLNFQFKKSDLIIPVSSRKHSVSFNRIMDEYPYELVENFSSNNCILVYPEHDLQGYFSSLNI